MKNLNKFAAMQLSKNQMNNVKGGDGSVDDCGRLYHCVWSEGENYVCEKNFHELSIILADKTASCEIV